MKKILIIHYSMEIGGAESSLLGLLQSFDYTKYKVDLLLLNPIGELLELIPEEVHLLETPKKYKALVEPIKESLKQGYVGIVGARILGHFIGKKYATKTYMIKQYTHKFAMSFLPPIKGYYDMAISFIDPHYIIAKKVVARVKLAWLHTDFSGVNINVVQDKKMWDFADYIINVSDSCKKVFDKVHPELEKKSIVIENVLSEQFIKLQTLKNSVTHEMETSSAVRMLSIGRFVYPKNFDSIPDICRRILLDGLNVKWYLIGYGGSEELIRQKIKEMGMEEHVIILGKKENPYPYIKACDLYIQPSRYEGKCVAVREAQILEKPVIITNYVTAGSQLKNGIDGVVVPMDNEGCAKGIAAVIRDAKMQQQLIENIKKSDYTNSSEIEKVCNLIG